MEWFITASRSTLYQLFPLFSTEFKREALCLYRYANVYQCFFMWSFIAFLLILFYVNARLVYLSIHTYFIHFFKIFFFSYHPKCVKNFNWDLFRSIYVSSESFLYSFFFGGGSDPYHCKCHLILSIITLL